MNDLQCGGLVLGAFVLVSIAVPVILPVFVPLALIFYWVRARYIAASRDIKRFEAVTRSPVYATFGAALKGLPTIRAYNAAARFQVPGACMHACMSRVHQELPVHPIAVTATALVRSACPSAERDLSRV